MPDDVQILPGKILVDEQKFHAAALLGEERRKGDPS